MLYLVETRLAAATHTLIADLLRRTPALMAARTLDPLGADPGLWQVYDTVLARTSSSSPLPRSANACVTDQIAIQQMIRQAPGDAPSLHTWGATTALLS